MLDDNVGIPYEYLLASYFLSSIRSLPSTMRVLNDAGAPMDWTTSGEPTGGRSVHQTNFHFLSYQYACILSKLVQSSLNPQDLLSLEAAVTKTEFLKICVEIEFGDPPKTNERF